MIHLCLAINPDLKKQRGRKGGSRGRELTQPGMTLADAGTGRRCALLCKALGRSRRNVE